MQEHENGGGGGLEIERWKNKGSVRELNNTANTKSKLNKKGTRKCHHPKHGEQFLELRERPSQPASHRSRDSSRFRRPHIGMAIVHTLYSSLQVDLLDSLS